ncbi:MULTISPECIES: hypothetical protein [unclassified Bradyrhizobium]|uniref:hypothetical protein n=1 Tax=unclassified Bradyrhizobium TaxID=2631580 RepID=UPI00247AC8D3|nr:MULTISPECIES: hypothetical protein [unclassified Bradyrhizobium]WGS20189.1 hypothetical protein MTX22_38875 [Bradyrhizobium sp. ISRA463]WGS27052.1 hypothetical protein MTX19_36300 [Bradyrhizobium sp. ISRA464]
MRSIASIPSAFVASEPVELEAVVVQRDDGRYLLDVVPARRVRDLEQEGLAQIALAELRLKPLTLTAGEIRREPRYANSWLVRSLNGIPVPLSLRWADAARPASQVRAQRPRSDAFGDGARLRRSSLS